jgi:branched-chain amino acid transport system substrate-binding protein
LQIRSLSDSIWEIYVFFEFAGQTDERQSLALELQRWTMLQNFRRSRSPVKGLLLVLAIVVMTMAGACAGEEEEVELNEIDWVSRNPQSPIVIADGEPVVVGVSAALTGPIAPRGLAIRDAVVVGVERWKAENGEQIGGHDIVIYAEDDGCYEAIIPTFAAQRLLSKSGLVGVIGPECSSGTMAAIPVYAEAGAVAISASATRSDLTLTQPEPRFFFRAVYSNAAEGIVQARYALSQLNATTACVIDDSESYGIDLADAAQQALESSGVQVTRESILTGMVDFSELAAQCAAENPDVVIFEGFNPEGALLYRQLRDAGYDGSFMSGDAVASVPDFVVPLGEQAEGVVFAGCMPELPEEFLADFIEIVGREPVTPFAAHVVDAVYILLDAVVEVAEEQDGSLVIDPLELRDAVSNPSIYAGLSGLIEFDENGDRSGTETTVGLHMCKVEDGGLVPVMYW